MSVLLQGRNGNEFELGFLRDSYPEVQDGTGDSTWVTTLFRVATADESWEEASPCVNLFEFSTLADWLEAAASSPGAAGAEPNAIELLGPELRFSVSGVSKDAVTIRVSFVIAERPHELDVDSPTGSWSTWTSRRRARSSAPPPRACAGRCASSRR